MKILRVFCCQPEKINDIVSVNSKFCNYNYSNKDYCGILFIAIFDNNTRMCEEVIPIKHLSQDKINELNRDNDILIVSNKSVMRFLGLLGFKKLKTINGDIRDEYSLNAMLYRFFIEENKHLMDKKRIDKFFSYPDVFWLIEKEMLENKVLQELFGDLKTYFSKFIDNRKTLDSVDFATCFYHTFLRQRIHNLAFLMNKEQAIDYLKFTLDQKNKNKMVSPSLFIGEDFNNHWLLEGINWNEYFGTPALKRSNKLFIDAINKIEENRDMSANKDAEILKKYNFYISGLLSPAVYKAEYLATFFFILSDEEFDIIINKVKGNLNSLVNVFGKVRLVDFVTSKERCLKLLNVFMSEIDLIRNKRVKENYISNFIKVINNFNMQNEIEYTREIKAFIIKRDLLKV